jgi:hypothetical protein
MGTSADTFPHEGRSTGILSKLLASKGEHRNTRSVHRQK